MFIHKREVWLIDFEPSIGIEIQKVRPAIVLHKFSKEHYIVLPITSTHKDNKISFVLNNISFLKRRLNYINISQIRAVDSKRFIRKFGKLSSFVFVDLQSKTAEVLKLLPQKPNGHNV